MWTEITRPKYEREGPRYASDLTDGEWALIEPHMPAVKRLGRPRETAMRTVLDAIFYIARTGCQWRMLPKDPQTPAKAGRLRAKRVRGRPARARAISLEQRKRVSRAWRTTFATVLSNKKRSRLGLAV